MKGGLETFPPNQPNIFCAPWAKMTAPSTTRRTAGVKLLSVPSDLRNMMLLPHFCDERGEYARARELGTDLTHPKLIVSFGVGCSYLSSEAPDDALRVTTETCCGDWI